MIRTPIYQPRIPIGRGGGVIDLSSKENESNRLIAQAVGEMFGNIAKGMQKQKEQPVQGKIVMAGDKALLIDPYTGETIKEIPMPPDSGRKVLEELAKTTKAAEGIPQETLEQPIIDAITEPLRQKAIGTAGFEEYEIPAEKRSRLGIDWLARDKPARTGVRKKGVQPQVAGPAEGPVESKTRPPQPKEYPDAEWSEEHQMWTIIKNGRIMGVK